MSRATSRAAREHLGGGQRAAREPDRRRLLARDVASGQEELGRAREADRARHGPVGVRVGQDAAADVGEGELGLERDQPDVALHGEREPDADGVTVDRGDHGLPHVPGGKRERIGAELGLVAPRERVGPGREVRPDAEGRARRRSG